MRKMNGVETSIVMNVDSNIALLDVINLDTTNCLNPRVKMPKDINLYAKKLVRSKMLSALYKFTTASKPSKRMMVRLFFLQMNKNCFNLGHSISIIYRLQDIHKFWFDCNCYLSFELIKINFAINCLVNVTKKRNIRVYHLISVACHDTSSNGYTSSGRQSNGGRWTWIFFHLRCYSLTVSLDCVRNYCRRQMFSVKCWFIEDWFCGLSQNTRNSH